MSKAVSEKYVKLLSEILESYVLAADEYRTRNRTTGVDDDDFIRIKTRSLAALRRIVGEKSDYFLQFSSIIKKVPFSVHGKYDTFRNMMAVIRALHEDFSGGFLDNYDDVIRGVLFDDFLEQAEYLCNEDYKDAAAVIAGSTLESHLRKLCLNNQIDIHFQKNSRKIPKNTNRLKDDLSSQGIISKTMKKQVTLWLDIRNNAAHGNYNEYTKEQVSVFIQGLRVFISQTLS